MATYSGPRPQKTEPADQIGYVRVAPRHLPMPVPPARLRNQLTTIGQALLLGMAGLLALVLLLLASNPALFLGAVLLLLGLSPVLLVLGVLASHGLQHEGH